MQGQTGTGLTGRGLAGLLGNVDGWFRGENEPSVACTSPLLALEANNEGRPKERNFHTWATRVKPLQRTSTNHR
jgi:hypothetical protein